MGSQNWVWELNESWPVKPVAEMIRSEEVSDVILDGYNERPSLNWYSNQRVNNKSNPKDIKWVVSDNEIKSNYLIREKKCIEKRRTGKWKLIYCSDY